MNYNKTIAACCVGYVVQAIVNNFAPLLFITFKNSYGISLDKIALLVSFNFGLQLITDLVSSKIVPKVGYRVAVIAANAFSFIGLLGLAILPEFFTNPYVGIITAVIFYAIGGGLLEVVVSPIVEACPSKKKASMMSLLHSFYCWGHVLVVILSTLFFTVFGIENWKYMAVIWSLVPFFNGISFFFVPIKSLEEEKGGMSIRKLFSLKTFWLMMILMVCSGASEMTVSQWSSAFAEAGLNVSKTVGDLTGTCFFAVLMGLSRILYSVYSSKIKLKTFMFGSAVLCVISYLIVSLSPYPWLSLLGCALTGLSVGIMWPGTYSLAAGEIKSGGTAMFALLALGGDLGCSTGPALVGLISDDLKTGILGTVIFPAVMVFLLIYYFKHKKAMQS